MTRAITTLLGLVLMLLVASTPAVADSPVGFGQIYLNGALVRTLVPPSASPQEGTDNFYMVPGVGGVAAVGPGDAGYHGGHWKVFVVSGVITSALTSESAILAAARAGTITVTRNASADFKCPIQP